MRISQGATRMIVDTIAILLSALIGAVIGGLIVYFGARQSHQKTIDKVNIFWGKDIVDIKNQLKSLQTQIEKGKKFTHKL